MNHLLEINMKFVLAVFISASLVFGFSAKAQTPAELAKLAEGMKLDKTQVSGMIDMMVKMGKISKADADKAKKELSKYSQEDVDALQQQAIAKMKSSKSGGTSDLIPSQGEQIQNSVPSGQASPSDTGSAGESAKKEEPGYKEALDYLNN